LKTDSVFSWASTPAISSVSDMRRGRDHDTPTYKTDDGSGTPLPETPRQGTAVRAALS
jgi:hypothetical protein